MYMYMYMYVYVYVYVCMCMYIRDATALAKKKRKFLTFASIVFKLSVLCRTLNFSIFELSQREWPHSSSAPCFDRIYENQVSMRIASAYMYMC